MIQNVHLTHCLWLQRCLLASLYLIVVSLSPHNFSLIEVQRVCFNINNVFPLRQKLCGQFYLHQVFVLGMLLMKLLYTRRFCGNVNSAKLRSCAKTKLTPVTRIHCNIVTGRDAIFTKAHTFLRSSLLTSQTITDYVQRSIFIIPRVFLDLIQIHLRE